MEDHALTRIMERDDSKMWSKEALTPLEVQRSLAVLQDLAQKMALLATLSAPFSLNAQSTTKSINTHCTIELSKFVHDEFDRHLTEHNQLQARHAHLTLQWHDLVVTRAEDGSIDLGNEAASQSNTLHAQIAHVGQALTHNAGLLLQLLRKHPRVSGFDLKVNRELKEFRRLLDTTINELKMSGTYMELKTAVEEGRRVQDQITQISGLEQNAAATVSELEHALHAASISHRERMSDLHSTIAKLRQGLDSLKYEREVKFKYARRDAQAKVKEVERVFMQEEKEMEQTQSRLVAQQQLQKQSHQDLVDLMNKKQSELQGQVDLWTTKAEKDLKALDLETEEIKTARDVYASELEVLRARRREEVDDEMARLEALRARREEEKAKEVLRVESQLEAAHKIGKAVSKYAQKRKQKNTQAAVRKSHAKDSNVVNTNKKDTAGNPNPTSPKATGKEAVKKPSTGAFSNKKDSQAPANPSIKTKATAKGRGPPSAGAKRVK